MEAQCWSLIEIVCFLEPNIDGKYFSEADYSMLFGRAPNIRHAPEKADEVIVEVPAQLKKKVEAEKKDAGDGRSSTFGDD
jgi:hypothetical protein